MTIKTRVCSFVKCSLGAKSRTILLFLLLARVHLVSSTFAQSCQSKEDRAVSLSDGEKVWLRTTAESVQLNGSSTGCVLERDSSFKVTGKNGSLVITAIKTSSRLCEIDGVLLQVPNRSVFVSCRKNKDRAKEELEAIISTSNHDTVADFEEAVPRARKDVDPTEEPPPSTTDPPTEVPVTVDELWTGEDEEPSLMTTEEVPTTTLGARENPARPAGPPAIPFTPKLETTTVFPTKVSTIQLTPSETIITTTLNILTTISPTVVPSSSPTVPSRVATATSPTLRPTPTVPIVVNTALPPGSPEVTEPHEVTSTEESDGGKEATKPPLLESTPMLQETQDVMPSIIMANLPYIIGGAVGILFLLVFITILVVVSRRRKKKASIPGNLAAGRADYVRHQDAMDSQDMANVNILMYAADDAQHHVELEDIIDRHKDEASVPVIPKCLQDDNFE